MGDSDDIGLPKATMSKAIKERLPSDMRIAADANEIIMRCCQEFVHMLAAASNELSEKEKKSTIQPEHITKSLEELGFTSYLEGITEALESWKSEKTKEKQAGKDRKAARSNTNGLSPEELLQMQQQLFQQARERTLAAAAVAPAPEAPQQQQQE